MTFSARRQACEKRPSGDYDSSIVCTDRFERKAITELNQLPTANPALTPASPLSPARRPRSEGVNGAATAAVRDSIYSHIWLLSSRMGMRNYLIEGVSGTGKTSVCKELQRR